MTRIEPPVLAIDDGIALGDENRFERRLIANLIQHLDNEGFKPVWVDLMDGVRHEVTDMQSTMELVFGVNESAVGFRNASHNGDNTVLLELGSGLDMIVDYTFAQDDCGADVDGFNNAMLVFNEEEYA